MNTLVSLKLSLGRILLYLRMSFINRIVNIRTRTVQRIPVGFQYSISLLSVHDVRHQDVGWRHQFIIQ